MYKLVNGALTTPPKVWKGVIGYDRDLARLEKDGWKPLVEMGEGTAFEYIDKDDCIVKQYFTPKRDYKAERRAAYPELGDVVDALLKAYQGDDSELKVIITQRDLVKHNIPKEQ